MSETLAPRDHDGLEAALVELARSRQFRRPRKGYDRNYRGGVTRDEILAAHAELGEALDDFARRADADLAALLQQELLRHRRRLRGAQGARGEPRLPRPPAAGARPRARPRRRARGAAAPLHATSSSTSSRTPIRSRPRFSCCSRAPIPRVAQLARGDAGARQALRRRRPEAVDLSVPPGRRRHLPGGEGAPGRAAARPWSSCRSSFRAVPAVQRLVNAAFAPRMVEDHATLQSGYVPLAAVSRGARRASRAWWRCPCRGPYGRWGLTKTAIDESLPDAVAAFVHWLVEESGWRVTERDRPGEDLPVAAAARVPAVPPLHPMGRRRHAALRRGARGARDPAHARRRQVVPPARGGREPAHGPHRHRVAGRRAGRLRRPARAAVRGGRRGAARVPRARRRACIRSACRPPESGERMAPASGPRGRTGSGCSASCIAGATCVPSRRRSPRSSRRRGRTRRSSCVRPASGRSPTCSGSRSWRATGRRRAGSRSAASSSSSPTRATATPPRRPSWRRGARASAS